MLEQDEVDDIIGRALAKGVNFIDTADVYSYGESERTEGQALKNLGVARKDVILATMFKARRVRDRTIAAPRAATSWFRTMAAWNGCRPITSTSIRFTAARTRSRRSTRSLRALDHLRRQGLVRYFGVSNWTAWKIAKALGISEAKGYGRVETLQAYYSIAGRDLEREIVPMLTAESLGLMVWSPLAGGLLSGKSDPAAPPPPGTRRSTFDFPPVDRPRAGARVAAMREIGDIHGVSARVALAWLLAKPHVMSVIIGAKTVAQLEDNLAAAELTLSAEEMQRLDAVSVLPLEYPGWMVSRQGGARVPQPFQPTEEAK